MVRVSEVAVWWAACVGTWLLTLSSVNLEDLCVAIPAGLLCGLAATTGRRLAGGRWRPQLRWVRWLVVLPIGVVADTVGVWKAAARAAVDPARRGRRQVSRVPIGEPASVAAARQALVTLVVSASPGSLVIDVDPDAGELLVHSLADSAPSWACPDPSM